MRCASHGENTEERDMKTRWLVGALAVVVVAAAASLVLSGKVEVPEALAKLGIGKAKDKKPDVTLEFVPSEVVQPARVVLSRLIEFSGPLVAPNTAILRSKAAGTLLRLNVAEGSRVKAGQVLGTVDATEIVTRMAERRAMLESAGAQAAQAERSHATNERLADQQFISATALDNSRAALLTARAQLQAAKASLDTLGVAQRENTLVAPISGIVAKRYALPGEKLSMEQQVLSIVDLGRLELAGNVGTHEIASLTAGMPVRVSVEGLDTPVMGKLARIAPAAEAGTRSIGVTVDIDNPKETLRAGQYAVASVTLPDESARLTVPIMAVTNSGGQDFVWLLADGVLVRRAVITGRRDEREGRVEVLQGLAPGVQLLAARFDNLREGSKAVLVVRKAGAVASSAASTPTVSR
jgi:membrane fusion protein, multidrug efflux system